ncbi:MAG: hypothetical protein B6I38_06685 [Anaerolineaceae bacterium 4572_5.1]|nr:MAG: hypothetical protein B6I38_06685 [Anaerolineaceae bacterium 4572_5.1]
MNNNATVSDLPLSLLKVPNRFLELLKKNGVTNIDELALRIEEDPKSILAMEGIGPKTLLSLKTALENFSPDEPAEEHRPPVQSLGDQFKSASATEEKGNEEDKKDKKNKKDKKAKKEKKSKQEKRGKKNKKDKKDKKNKKDKKAKKDKKDKKPKKNKKTGKKKKKKK